MRLTDFPSYVLNDSWSQEDLYRAKSIVAEIENILSGADVDEIKSGFSKIHFDDSQFEQYSELFKKIDDDIFSFSRLFNQYLMLSKNSKSEYLRKVAVLFDEDFHILSELLLYIKSNPVNSMVYLEYLNKLINPYRTVIYAFIYQVNSIIAERKNHFSSVSSETKEFEEILKELEG